MKITKSMGGLFPRQETRKGRQRWRSGGRVPGVPMGTVDFTLPENREGVVSFDKEDLASSALRSMRAVSRTRCSRMCRLRLRETGRLR